MTHIITQALCFVNDGLESFEAKQKPDSIPDAKPGRGLTQVIAAKRDEITENPRKSASQAFPGPALAVPIMK
jgi:hypothetical protein